MKTRGTTTPILRFLAFFLVAMGATLSIWAGNPFRVNPVSGPLTWQNNVAPFNTDQGPLGILDNAAATQIVLDGFAAWEGVPTASLTAQNLGPIMLNGAPVDVDGGNWMQILFQLDGQSPVIYDHDGSIMDALGIGGFAGFSIGEFVTGDIQHYFERAIVLNGRDVDANGPFTPTGWRNLVAHEEGHHVGLAHSVVNAQAFFFGEPILGLPFPPVSSLETMYPFLHVSLDVQASPHVDDISILSVLYPAPGFETSTGAIRGNILEADFVTPLRGANVTVRNLADPFNDAVSNISGSFDFPFPGFFPDSTITGFYSADGLTDGASYSVAISDIITGGFSSPIVSPLPGPEEFYNGLNESNDPGLDIPSQLSPVIAQAGVPVGGIDLIINAAASIRIVDDPDVLDPPDDATVSGFDVSAKIDIRRVEVRFEDTDEDGGQETLFVIMDVVGPLGARNSDFRFELDFGERQRVGRSFLSLKDQTIEPGTKGVPTADVTLKVNFERDGPHFAGLPSLADNSHVDLAAGRIEFVASVAEIFALATSEQLSAANNLDGTFTLLGFSRSELRRDLDRVPDTNDNENPSIVQEVSQFTLFPFAVSPTHLASVPDGTLISVEEDTARTIRIGNVGTNSLSGLALSDDGHLFGSLGFGGGGHIVEINPVTAARVDIGPSGFAAVPALDFDPGGTLYGVGRTAAVVDFLLTIDTSTGLGTPVGGPIGFAFVDGIVFTDAGLFGVGFESGVGAVLIEIDPATGFLSRIIGPIGFNSVVGLEAASDGSLLGSLGGVDPQRGGLVRIDPVTGAGTFIGLTGFSPVSGLTRLP